MMPFVQSPWPGLVLWAVLYISDYACTLACARMYRAGVRDILVYEGSFELTPFYQRDIDALRRISPRFVLVLAASGALLSITWHLDRHAGLQTYFLMLGALVLGELAVHVRHARNFWLFRRTLSGRGARGRVEYDRPLILQLSAIDQAAFALIFFVAFIVTRSSFLLGGTIFSLINAVKHMRLAWKDARRRLDAEALTNKRMERTRE